MKQLLAALALALPAMAHAQAYQCRLPERVSVPPVRPDGPARQVPVTGYTLALSWSPEFCKARGRDPAQAAQCSGGNGRFGFVLHGLWPEGRGTSPQWCPTRRSLTPAELRRNLCMTPSAALLAHEWAKHGACMTSRPETYFKVARILWGSLQFPDTIRLSREDGLTAGRIREAFVIANPWLRSEHIGVSLNRRGWLEELRLCYGRNFRTVACDARRFGAKDSAPAQIWRGL